MRKNQSIGLRELESSDIYQWPLIWLSRVTGWCQVLGGGSWRGLWRKALHVFHSLWQELHIKHAFWIDGFYDILISLLHFCFKIHGFPEISILNFYPRIEPRIQPHLSQPHFPFLHIMSTEFWPHWTVVCFGWTALPPFWPLVTLPETLFLPVKPYHPSRPWLKPFPLFKAHLLLSAKTRVVSFLIPFNTSCCGVLLQFIPLSCLPWSLGFHVVQLFHSKS